jgi:hypothetical protein
VRAAVAEAEQHGTVVQDLGHAVDARVERGDGELVLEIIGEREIEERVDAVLAFRRGDLGDRPPLEVLQRRG